MNPSIAGKRTERGKSPEREDIEEIPRKQDVETLAWKPRYALIAENLIAAKAFELALGYTEKRRTDGICVRRHLRGVWWGLLL